MFVSTFLRGLLFGLCLSACAGRQLDVPDSSRETTPGDGTPTDPSTTHPTTTPSHLVDPGARFLWTSAGGVVGSGRSIEIDGDGKVRGWNLFFDEMPDFTDQLERADVTALFDRFAAVDRSMIPRKLGSFNECGISGSVRTCATCAEVTLDYSFAKQVLPEMQPVWDWFDEHARDALSVSDFTPAWYCGGPG